MPSNPPPEEHVAHRGLREGATSLIKEREIVKIYSLSSRLWILRLVWGLFRPFQGAYCGPGDHWGILR